MTIHERANAMRTVVRAGKAATCGPVFISEGGELAYVLLSIEDCRRLTGAPRSLVEALAMPGLSDIDFDPPRSRALPRAADFS